MHKHLIEMRYFETYYFANVVQGVVEDRAGSYLRGLEGWGGDLNKRRFLEAFPRWSHLHGFIAFLIDQVLHEEQCSGIFDKNGKPLRGKIYIDRALHHYQISWCGFEQFLRDAGKARDEMDEDDVYEYMQELLLCGPYEELVDRIAEEVFYITFLNRELLHQFNHLVSVYVSSLDESLLESSESHLLVREGVLKRVAVPKWAQRAVFYRDRGRCVYCNCDLTNLVNIQNKVNFDHIVPLVSSGINDVSNLQLLCEKCNLKKGGRGVLASRQYERWYDLKASQ